MAIEGRYIEDFDLSIGGIPTASKFLFQSGGKYWKIPKETLFTEIGDSLSFSTGDFADGGDVATAARSLGNNSSHSLSFKTNSTNRITITAAGNVGIGSAGSYGFHVNKGQSLFQTTSTLSGAAVQDNLILDYGGSGGGGSIGLYSVDSGYIRIIHRTPSNSSGACIDFGNDQNTTNLDGLSFKTGTSTSSSLTKYRLHIDTDGRLTIVNGVRGTFSATAGDFGKVNILAEGNSNSTFSIHVKNTSGTSIFKLWDDGTIGINKSGAPSCTLDINSTATGVTQILGATSGSGQILAQYANGNMIIGSGISAGAKVAIKGTSSAYAYTASTIPAAFHLVGTLRIDAQTTNSAGLGAGKFLTVNCDGVLYSIALATFIG